jgi:uncharacterized Zn-finger protein
VTLHLRYKQFVCKECGRKFAQKQYLTEHVNTHTQDHPYVCNVAGCKEKFKQRSRLCLHKKQHHDFCYEGQHQIGNNDDVDDFIEKISVTPVKSEQHYLNNDPNE